jgi:Ca2+-binding RTX toxin-like protein
MSDAYMTAEEERDCEEWVERVIEAGRLGQPMPPPPAPARRPLRSQVARRDLVCGLKPRQVTLIRRIARAPRENASQNLGNATVFEPLEFRRLLSVNHTVKFGSTDDYQIIDFNIGGNYFTDNPQHDFSGTAKDDVILVSPGAAANTVLVSVNGRLTETPTDAAITLHGNGGDDKIHIDLGDDPHGATFTIYGGAGDDTIVGCSAAERIIAGDGNDNVNGLGGRDTIYAEGGDDSIRGGGSSDLLDGGAGNDTVRGDAGNDRCLGGDGFDRIRGSDGNDSCEGGASKDFIGGENGDDQLAGEGGDDVMSGGAGNDILGGGAGDDVCDGNDGDDLLAGGSGSNDQLFGDAGDDGFAAGDEPHECMDIKEEDLEAARSNSRPPTPTA